MYEPLGKTEDRGKHVNHTVSVLYPRPVSLFAIE